MDDNEATSGGGDPGRLQEKPDAPGALVLETMSLISHELKSPLVSIGGFATTMLVQWEAMTDSDKVRYLGIISGQAERLSRLIDDLLVITKAEAGVLQPIRFPISAMGAIRQCLLHTGQDEEFEVVCDEELEVLVDANHLQHMLTNCVINAVHHGAAPFRLEAQAGDGEIEFRIVDSGEGVPPELLPHLFDKFTRGVTASKIRGSGVGLAAARSLAEAGGGSVSYSPNVPSGAVFILRLPVAS